MTTLVKNNAFGVLASAITAGATTLTLQTGQGARFPAIVAPDFFYLTLIDASQNLEIVLVTARSSDTLTVIRGQQGTTARAYAAGDRAEMRITAENFLNASYDTYKSALGTVTAGDVVAVRSDDKVFSIAGYAKGETHQDVLLYTGNTILNGAGVASNADGSVILAAYGIAGSDIQFRAATVGTDGTLTWGTAVTIATTIIGSSDIKVVYNATGDYFVVFYTILASTVTARIITYSGNTITQGNATATAAQVDDDADQWAFAYHSGSNKIVHIYNASATAYPTVNYVDCSSGTPVWGTPVTVESVASGTAALMADIKLDPTTGNLVAAYEQGTTIRVVAVALSGTTFTVGTPVTITGGNSTAGWFAVGIDSTRNRILVVDTNKVANEYSLSGTTLTAQTTYSLGLQSQASSIAYNSTTKTLIAGCRDYLEFFQWNGSNYVAVVDYGKIHVTGGTGAEGVVALVRNNKCVFLTNFDYSLCVQAGAVYYSSVNVPGSNYYTEGAVGVLGIAYSGATAIDGIVVAAIRGGGGIVTKAGVAAGTKYYVRFDGTLHTSNSGVLDGAYAAFGTKSGEAMPIL